MKRIGKRIYFIGFDNRLYIVEDGNITITSIRWMKKVLSKKRFCKLLDYVIIKGLHYLSFVLPNK